MSRARYHGRLERQTKITRAALGVGSDAAAVVRAVPRPPVVWIERSARGAHYLATGARERLLGEVDDDFIMNRVTVTDRSEGSRYIRPARARRLLATDYRISTEEPM